MTRLVVIIDDETSILQSLAGALQDENYRVKTASNAIEGLELLKAELPSVVLLDIWMPGKDGIETLKQIKLDYPDLPVIMMSGHGTIETAVKSTKLGAYDFIEKPLSLEKILVLLQNATNFQDLTRENVALRKQVQKHKLLIGQSPAIQQIQELIRRVAPTTGSVLITGENGAGKEIVAHSIHALSPRYLRPFIEVNCAAIPEELIESELFGHEKGAFTGATQLRRGKFDQANGGTLFLDEIGDMSLKTQAKILRILQEQKFERVGGSQTISVDVRIVAATNKDLRAAIAIGEFREDLFYRLNVIPFVVPPLRDRKEDIGTLARHFLKEMAQTHQRPERLLTPEAQAALEVYRWPGNVRELKNLIERMVIIAPESEQNLPITGADVLGHLQTETQTLRSHEMEQQSRNEELTGSFAKNLRDARGEFEKDFILKSLKECDWNVSKTAQALGIERSHLHRKIKSYGIDPEGK
jgi:two-component system nitrogen regulation response regulator NtrX